MGFKAFLRKCVKALREAGEMRVSEHTASATSGEGHYSIAGDLWHDVGSRHLKKKRFEKAEQAFKKALENYERVEGGLRNSARDRAGGTSMALGDCYKKWGKIEEAVEAYGKAAEYLSEAKCYQWELKHQEALKKRNNSLKILNKLKPGPSKKKQ